MSDTTDHATLQEVETRFAQIRKKLNFSQKQVGDQLGITTRKVSYIETGANVTSAQFLQMLQFYSQLVFADKIIGKKFDINDPQLFNKDLASSNIANSIIKDLIEHIGEDLGGTGEDLTVVGALGTEALNILGTVP